MSATTTHYLSKEEVSEKLQSVSYSFQESYWESFLESQGSDSAKFASPKSPTLKIKLSPKLIIIPISLIAVSAIIYFSVTNLNSGNTPKDKEKNTEETTILSEPQTKENTIAPNTNTVSTPPKQEITATPVPNVPKKEEPVTNSAQPNSGKEVAKTPKKEDTSAASTQTSKVVKEEKNKVVEQTPVAAEEKKEVPAKKKRRHREKKSEGNTLVPNPEEDNVVIPEN